MPNDPQVVRVGQTVPDAPPPTPCRQLGHDFAQRQDRDGSYLPYLFCRRCGKQRKMGQAPEW